MRRLLTLLFVWFVVLPMGGRSQAPSPPAGPKRPPAAPMRAGKVRGPHVGTWKSVANDQHKLSGELVSQSGPENDNSFIIFDGVGHFGVTNMPISSLKSKANDQLTPDEAKEIVAGRKAPNRSASAYFGTYTLNVSDRYVVNHVLGMVDPIETGTDRFRLFEFSGNLLNLKILPLTRSDQISWRVWERVPSLERLTPTHRRLIGFWKLISNERRKASGERLSSTPIEAGYIIYASSGRMAVHLIQPNRKKWAAPQPTPAEAQAALSTYTAYTGLYTIDEAKRLVTHHGVGAISGQKTADAQHAYEFSGTRLVLTSPLTMVDGQEVRTIITGERVSGDDPAPQP